jgi:hypothetical protein
MIRSQKGESLLKKAVGEDWKGKLSVTMYVLGILAAFRAPRISVMLYTVTGIIWFVPDKRIERVVTEER